MMTHSDTPETKRPRLLSDAQVADAFERLGLNDPAVREFYRRLDAMSPDKPVETLWLRTDIHSVVNTSEF